MNPNEGTLSSGLLVTALVEVIKIIWRWAKKDPTYDPPMLFYVIVVPLLNALAPFGMFALGLLTNDPILSMKWQDVLVYVGRVVAASLVSFFANNTVLKPAKEYEKARLVAKNALP